MSSVPLCGDDAIEYGCGSPHLAENRERVLMSFRCKRVDENGDDGVAVWLDAGREPEGDSGEIAETPDGLFSECPAAKLRDESREAGQVPPRFRIHPSLDGIGRERQDEGVDDPLSVVPAHTRDPRSVHLPTVSRVL
jgi:hypothetical protein